MGMKVILLQSAAYWELGCAYRPKMFAGLV